MVLESTGESTFKMILDLLKSLWKSSTITIDQMKRVCMTLFEVCFYKAYTSTIWLSKGYELLVEFLSLCVQYYTWRFLTF